MTSGEYELPGIAASHLYKQAGNSVSVPVIERLAECVFEVLNGGSSAVKKQHACAEKQELAIEG